jgi:uncharacterized membrane protein YfcA
MVLLMRFPSYIATATSTFSLMFTAFAGVVVHVAAGHYDGVLGEEMTLAIGVLIGAQLGARLSMHLQSRQGLVLRLLSVALGFVGLRLVLGQLS